MSSDDGRITCGICGTVAFEGGDVGRVAACVKCYNKFEAEAVEARVVAAANRNLSAMNDGLQAQNVAQDQAIENDTRVIELRAEVEMLKRENLLLKERVSFLEMQVSQLNELARG